MATRPLGFNTLSIDLTTLSKRVSIWSAVPNFRPNGTSHKITSKRYTNGRFFFLMEMNSSVKKIRMFPPSTSAGEEQFHSCLALLSSASYLRNWQEFLLCQLPLSASHEVVFQKSLQDNRRDGGGNERKKSFRIQRLFFLLIRHAIVFGASDLRIIDR